MDRTRRLFWVLAVFGLIFCLSFVAGCLGGEGDGGGDDDDTADDDTDDTTPPEFDGLQSAESDDSGNIVLSWNAATDESTPITYNIYMGTESGGEDFDNPVASTQELGYTISGLEICNEYFFVVRAVDAAGNEDDNTVEKSAIPVNYHCDYSDAERVVWTFSVSWGPYDIESLAWINDVDGDGVPDVLVESPECRDGFNSREHLFCLSGASGVVIWGVRPANDAGAGSGGWGDKCLNRSPDLDGDGYDDVLFTSAWGDRTAYAISGVDGSIIWKFDSYTNPQSPNSGWGYEIQPVPDITGDGVPEVTFCFGSDNDSAYLVNGATGEVLWRLTASADALESLAVMGDVNGDGAADIVFGGGDIYEQRAFCVSGASSDVGQLIWTRNNEGSNWTMTSIADVDDDGVREVVIGVWSPARVMAISGADGALIWQYAGAGFYNPMRVVNIGDVDGDGYDDVAVASWSNFIVAISGATGDEIWRASTEVEGDDVWAVDVIDDINGDGVKDVVAGSFSSLVYTIDGATGEVLWGFYSGGSKIMTVRSIPDVTGDCVADVIAGTQALDPDAPDAGTVYLLQGCP